MKKIIEELEELIYEMEEAYSEGVEGTDASYLPDEIAQLVKGFHHDGFKCAIDMMEDWMNGYEEREDLKKGRSLRKLYKAFTEEAND